MNELLVSICIPVFNGEIFLEEALQSIEKQTYRNIEVIISDDGSTDSSLFICKQFKEHSSFPVYIYRHENKGIGANWNHCLNKAKGYYIKFLFQDDLLLADCLSEMIKSIEQDKEIKLVACKRKIICDPNIIWQKKWKERYGDLQINLNGFEENRFIIDSSILKDQNFFKDPYNRIGEPTAVLFERNIIEEIGGFRTIK